MRTADRDDGWGLWMVDGVQPGVNKFNMTPVRKLIFCSFSQNLCAKRDIIFNYCHFFLFKRRGVGKNYRNSSYWRHVKCCNAGLKVVTRQETSDASVQEDLKNF